MEPTFQSAKSVRKWRDWHGVPDRLTPLYLSAAKSGSASLSPNDGTLAGGVPTGRDAYQDAYVYDPAAGVSQPQRRPDANAQRADLPASDIDAAWDDRQSVSPATQGAVREAVEAALDALDSGLLRVAEKKNGTWSVNQWLKKAVLLSFRLEDSAPMHGGYDKVVDSL